jgi:DNA helicase II / ATP-dependent DNA helicase PcrA
MIGLQRNHQDYVDLLIIRSTRVLAGPGTGKTWVLTRRIEYLIDVKGVNPNQILALTFTRAAAGELSKRVAIALGDENTPRISTLHSFALKQLLRNSRKIISLPQPLRIADDWEEANIIFPDIKRLLKLSRTKLAKELFDSLASDWESLVPEENLTPDPKFIASWKTHRKIFGYTLRSELVYQLKRSIEQISDFELEHPLRYLLVDEYQDLNKCELAVVKAIEEQSSVEVYIAGDDDQSIYLFRKAHPEGIRNFHKEFDDVQDIPLTVCKRCDSSILDIAEFVANLDDKRLPKKIYPESGRNAGEVKLLAFANQHSEAEGIAGICRYLIEKENISPEQILILLRSDSNGVFSREIVEAFGEEIPISVSKKGENVFDTTFGRQIIAIFRLLRNREDHLSWRTLIQIRTKNSLGEKTQSDLYDLARENNLGYYEAIVAVINNSIQVSFRDRLFTEFELISNLINSVNEVVNSGQDPSQQIKQIIDFVLPEEYRQAMIQFFMELIEKENPPSISDLIGKLETSEISDWNVEQEIEKGKVNVLTMHRAKGLTADVVFVVGAEDQLIPGSNLSG